MLHIEEIFFGIWSSARIGGVFTILSILYFMIRLIWNLYYHPLSKYPGPKLWAATGLINASYVLQGSRTYEISKLHNQYGPIVRVAPNELSYVHEDAWKDIYHKIGGKQLSKYVCPSFGNLFGIFNHPSDEGHSKIRKLLSPGFSEKSIREKEVEIQKLISLLILRLKEKSVSESVDLVAWFDSLGTDISGYMVFGESFNALQDSKVPEVIPTTHHFLKSTPKTLVYLEYPLTTIWGYLSMITDGIGKFFHALIGLKLSRRRMRMENEEISAGSPPDLTSLLMKNFQTPKGLSKNELLMVSADLMVAGADTTATALCGAVYHLLKSPSKLAILINEIRSTFASETDITLTNVNTLKYQNAVLSEAGRLLPAGPETTRRLTNTGGNIICGQFVPAGIRVGVYHWAAGHNSASFHDVESFIPERWLGAEKYESDVKGVISPFNAGPRNCVGQNLAMAQMRLVLARILWNFDLKLCEESRDWVDMKAYTLVYEKRPLMVELTSIRK